MGYESILVCAFSFLSESALPSEGNNIEHTPQAVRSLLQKKKKNLCVSSSVSSMGHIPVVIPTIFCLHIECPVKKKSVTSGYDVMTWRLFVFRNCRRSTGFVDDGTGYISQDMVHGMGTLISEDNEKRRAIYWRDRRVCFIEGEVTVDVGLRTGGVTLRGLFFAVFRGRSRE